MADQRTQRRLCWVCFGTELEDEDSNVLWISPCNCKGTLKWVHDECLQRWIDEKQRRTNSIRVSCSQCKMQYILSFPPVNSFVRLIERYDKLLYSSSPFVAVSVVMGSVYWCCGSYGFCSLIQVMGYEDGRRIIDEADPLLLVIGLPVIPIALILAKLIKWEEFLLQLWKRSAFKLPWPISQIIGQPPSQPRANCDQLLQDPKFNEPLDCTRMICGALLLPTFASLFGKLIFHRLPGGQWRRSLLGGLAFLLLKGVLKIYMRKSLYVRYSQRTIKNFNHCARAGQSAGQSVGHADGDTSSGDLDLDSGSQTTTDDHEELMRNHWPRDGSDDESQMPRARTMFSMTIRL